MKKSELKQIIREILDEDLRNWFKKKRVNIGNKDQDGKEGRILQDAEGPHHYFLLIADATRMITRHRPITVCSNKAYCW